MEKKFGLTAEEMLDKIFWYMNQLAEERDFEASVLLLTDLGRTLVNADRASFWYRDTKNKQYWTLAASEMGRIVVPEGMGIVGASIENNKIILLNNPYGDSRFNPKVDKESGYITRNILCMPVTNSSGTVIGAYQVINKLSENNFSSFDETDKKHLALAATYSGKLLEAHLLRQQSQVDYLTGLRNRKGFYDYYEHQILPFTKIKMGSIIMCDIDFFKKVNDTYGHNAGDAVLVAVSDIMQKCVAKAGEVFRWGGEEFIILLPQYELSQAAQLAEKIRCQIEKSDLYIEGHTIPITMSFGVKELEQEKTLKINIQDADENLYKAKLTGRNKVVT